MATPTSTRDPWLDNAKMGLVTLVVIGHFWTLLPGTPLTSRFYDFLYAWHMPAFVVVTGYLSRSFSYRRDKMWKLFRSVVVPYLVFEALMALFRIYVGGEKLEDLFTDPHWPMWFLAALFFWRLLTPIFRPMWGGLIVAVVISLIAGLWAGDTLDAARVLGLLPFFVLGLKATPERLEVLRHWLPRLLAVGVFLGIWLLTKHTDDLASTEWLYYRAQYDELAVSNLEAVWIRLALLGLGTLGTFAFLALTPRRDGWFARMGAWTLVVYLCHGFIVKGMSYTEFPQWSADNPNAALALLSTLGLIVSLILAAPPIAWWLSHLVDPVGAAEQRVKAAVELTAVSQEPEAEAPAEDALRSSP